MNKPGNIGLRVKRVTKDTRFTFNLSIAMKELLYAEAALSQTTPSQIVFDLIEKHQLNLKKDNKDKLILWIEKNKEEE
jgi:hypothetical protein